MRNLLSRDGVVLLDLPSTLSFTVCSFDTLLLVSFCFYILLFYCLLCSYKVQRYFFYLPHTFLAVEFYIASVA